MDKNRPVIKSGYRRAPNGASGNSYRAYSNTIGRNNVSIEILVATFVILLLNPVFWNIVFNSFFATRQLVGGLALELLQSAILALGFVGIAIRWERGIVLIARMFLVILLISLAFISVIWSKDAAFTLKSSVSLVLVFTFSIAIALRFGERKLSIIAAMASTIMLIWSKAFLIASPNIAPNDLAIGLEIGICLVANVWAAYNNPRYLLAFGAITLFCAIIGILSFDVGIFGVIIALIGGGFVVFFARIGKNGILSIGGAVAVLLILFTLFLIQYGNALSEIVYSMVNDDWRGHLIGAGFGIGGDTVPQQIVSGLGLIGFLVGILWIFFTIGAAVLAAHKRPTITIAIFGFVALGLLNTDHFALISPLCIFWISTLSLSLIKK